MDSRWLGVLEALIAGSLLHVVVHRPSPLSTPSHDRRERLAAGVGALLGIATVAALGGDAYVPSHEHHETGFADGFPMASSTAAQSGSSALSDRAASSAGKAASPSSIK